MLLRKLYAIRWKSILYKVHPFISSFTQAAPHWACIAS